MNAHRAIPAPLRLGMVGGGIGALIGPVHRTAAALDAQWEVVAGALSSTPERALESARAIGLSPGRSYPTWREMLARESALPEDERIDAVTIVTPNHLHAEPAIAFLDAGFHVIVDKPMAATAADARRMAEAAARADALCVVSYNYSGYPMVRQAAAMIRDGAIGKVRTVFVEYHQGWLASSLESSGHKQASWRTDPARAGAGGALGDIGSHAFHLLEFVTGLRAASLLADTRSFVAGRRLDDDAGVLLRLADAAVATLTVSQVCIGEDNNLTIRVHAERGSITWRQQSPDTLVLAAPGSETRTFSRGAPGLDAAADAGTRLPPGHPEGFFEAFANIYRDAAASIRARRAGQPAPFKPSERVSPIEGVRGLIFIEACAGSAAAGSAWVDLPA